MKKARNNPFSGIGSSEALDAEMPALSSWQWDLSEKVPGGKVLYFTRCQGRPKLFQPLLRALWFLNVDCIPVKGFGWISSQRDSLSRFAEYLDRQQDAGIYNLTSLNDLTRDMLLDYRRNLDSSYKSATAHRHYLTLTNLLSKLQGENSPWPGSVPAVLEIPKRALRGKDEDTDRTQPFTGDEEKAIIEACKQEMNEILQRLATGRKWLAEGVDPRSVGELRQPWNPNAVFTTGWDSKANVLWYIKNVLGGMTISRGAGKSELLYRYFANARDYHPFGSKSEAYTYLYPHLPDLVPFIILLCLKSGLNGESILALKRDCLKGSMNGKTTVEFIKNRGSHEVMTRAFSHRGSLSPVGIIKTVLQMTDHMVSMAPPEERNNLWLAYILCKGVSVGEYSNKISEIGAQNFYRTANGYTAQGCRVPGFMEQKGLRDSQGKYLTFGFKTGRTTNATGEYLRKGNLALVSQKTLKHHGKQGINTTAFHYLTNDATQHVHDRAIRNAQDKLVQEARQVVITEENSTADAVSALATSLAESEEKMMSILKGEQDVFISACRDFYNKPGGVPNTPCADPWQCFSCKNALWTSRILPRLVKFMWFIEEQKKMLIPDDWNNKFGLPYAVITKNILPRFQTRTVEWAKAEAATTPFYVPAHLKEI